MSYDLNQIIAETPYTRLSDEYIIKGIIITPNNEIVEIDKDILKVLMNKRPDELSDDEIDILENILDNVDPSRFLVEISIHYDMEKVKEDIEVYVDEMINKIFN